MELKGIYTADAHRYDDSEALYQWCGKSGVLLPKISLGFWHNFGGVDPYERSREITHYSFDHGITHSFSPLAQGLLTDRYLNGIPADSRMAKEHFLKQSVLTPELLNQLKKWNAQACERNETLAEMALAWILSQKGVTSVLVGASSAAQLEKNMKCVHTEPFVLAWTADNQQA